MNEHGSARTSGLISYDKRDEYLKMAAKETWIKILRKWRKMFYRNS